MLIISRNQMEENMTPYEAVMIAEGIANQEDITEEVYLEAWQLLVDTGLAYQLQGWFGRQANQLIEQGLIQGRAA